jgi:tRNA(Ile)-lysidine synthase
MACKNSEIETLLMGHHQDDNVETTLWRLCSGARGAGLSGIPPVARIPECHGLYGVSESGSCSILRRSDRDRDLRPPQIRIDQKTGEARVSFLSTEQQKGKKGKKGIITAASTEIIMSTGGILICRPLLSFPKSRLIDTCHHNQVPYVTDPTNFDATLTPRNAIRSLLSSKKLPRALQAPSVLSLIKKSQDLLRESTESSNRLLRECKIHDFNSEVGTMIVQIPSLYDREPGAISQDASSKEDRQIQAMTLRRITELLSPFEENHFPLQSFDGFTERVFPKMMATTTTQSSFRKRQPFTVGGVMFRAVTEFIPPDPDSSSKTGDNTWLLSRQPYMRHRLPTIRLEASVGGSSAAKPVYSPWILWDNRYWFRVRVVVRPVSENNKEGNEQNHLNGEIKNTDVDDDVTKESITIPIIIRPLQQADLRSIYRLLDQYHSHKHKHKHNSPSNNGSHPPPTQRQLKYLLSNYAPDTVRFSIPIITTMHHLKEGEGQRPLALPTMGIRIPSSPTPTTSPSPNCGVEQSTWTVHWEWMYKRVDTEVLRLMGWEVQG